MRVRIEGSQHSRVFVKCLFTQAWNFLAAREMTSEGTFDGTCLQQTTVQYAGMLDLAGRVFLLLAVLICVRIYQVYQSPILAGKVSLPRPRPVGRSD